ncbi:MAG: YggS family pyridoxal phosphate-dependent enzyme [Odoribacter sp.]
MSIQGNITKIIEMLPNGVKLIAVSKTKPVEAIEEAYAGGQRAFGENRPQEMATKFQALPQDIEWHLIGQLQEKNVKYIAPFVTLIHSVDSLRLLEKINREAAKNGRVIDCLLEFHIAQEESKAGLSEEEAVEILQSEVYREMKNIRMIGVMGIATNTDDQAQIHKEFHLLRQLFEHLKNTYFQGQDYFKELSMGMSGDYQIAVEEGSTMVRVGSSIFGEREYKAKN